MQNFALVDAQEEYEEHTMAAPSWGGEFDAKSANRNVFFSMFSNDMTYFEGYHVKADVLRIPKMWYFLRFRAFKPEFSLLKDTRLWNLRSVTKIIRRQKKLTFAQKICFCLFLPREVSKLGLKNPLRRFWYNKFFWKNVSFFDTDIFWNILSIFHATSGNDNSGIKDLNLKKYHIFGILRTSAFRWYTLDTS